MRTKKFPALPDNHDLEMLQTFDAVPANVLTQTTDIRAEARLEQIMATNLNSNPTIEPMRAKLTKKQLAFRFAAIPALAAGLIAASVLAPSGTSIAPAPAFATWTSTPSPLEGERFDLANVACLTEINEAVPRSMFLAGVPEELQFTETPSLPAPQIAEQRGDWALLVWEDSEAQGAVANCLLLFNDGVPEITHWLYNSGSATTIGGDRNESLRSSSYNWDNLPAEDGTAVVVTAFEAEEADNGGLKALTGRVGADVVGLVFHTGDGTDVTATVTAGQFAAWWPTSIGILPVEIISNSPANPNFREDALAQMATSVTVTLADGSVLANQDIHTHAPRAFTQWGFGG